MLIRINTIILILYFTFFSLDSIGQVASFTPSITSGCVPVGVNFVSTSTGTITSYFWDLGNGVSSVLQNAGTIYSNAGSFTVCLTVTDGVVSNTFCDTINVYDPPIINFIGVDSAGCSPLNVNFSNLTSTGTGIASSVWNFGNGQSSNQVNPSHTFSPGIYDITLVVTDSSGCVSQGDKIAYIQSIVPPTANFTATNTQNCAVPNVVNFTNMSTQSTGATYLWNFGDGTPNSTLQNPNHAYTTFGNFDVKLIVNKNGCRDSITKLNFVTLLAQDANFSVNNTTICVGNSVSFTDLSILTGITWDWDFGDGTPHGTAQNPSHTYNTAGVYTVNQTVNIPNCNDVETKINLITVNANPTTAISSNVTDTCAAPFSVNFSSVSSLGVTYNWNFGDGNNDVTANPTHLYSSTGSFNVSLTVTNANNCTATASTSSMINITPPVANFSIDSAFGCSPKTVTFADMSTSANPFVNWIWDFGDGSPIVNGIDSPSHLYTDTGTYIISLIVIDSLGCTDTLNPGLDISLGQTFDISFTASPFTACKLTPIDFTNTTDTVGISGVQWLWDFGDGGISNLYETEYEYGDTGYFSVSLSAIHNGCSSDTTVDSMIQIYPPIAEYNTVFDCVNLFDVEFQDNSIGSEAWTWNINGDTILNDTTIYTFPDTGVYDITLYVENLTYGCLDSINGTVTIVNPTINFSYDDSIGCPPFLVNFTDLSSQVTGWSWDFDDGGTSNQQNPAHTFNSPGIYDVQLVTTSLNGCTDTLLMPQIINVLSSSPNFIANDTAGCRPFNVNFSDLSTSNGGFINNWSWNFGDGSSSTLQNPTHTYSTVGNFTVSLQVTDSTGCIGTFTRNQYINSTGPTPSFNSSSAACIYDLVQFNSTSASLGGIVTNWLWHFGDGDSSILENPQHAYNSSGNYDVSLYILDDNGCDSTITFNNTIQIDSLTVDFVADSTVGACTGFIVNFSELVSPSPTSWSWDFGNGTTSSVANPIVVFNNVGNFNVTLIASNSSGCVDTLVKPNFITVAGPSGTLTATPDSGCINLDVLFNIQTTNSINQQWDFGDGLLISNSLTTMVHTYLAVDTFIPKVILDDGLGCLVLYEFDTIITGSLNADIFFDKNYLCTPDLVNFVDSSNSNPPIISWKWDFGNGDTSILQNPTNTYNSDGIYDIQLIVSNGLCIDTAIVNQAIVSDSSTNSLFTINPPALLCPPAVFNFGNLSSSDSTITNWAWDFGNTQIDNTQNPVGISYTNDGLYTVTLDITTINGCTSHFEDTLRVFTIPTFAINLDTIELCFGLDTMIQPLADADFTWSPATNLSCADCPDPIIYSNNNQTYYVTGVTNFGCTFNDTLELIVHGSPPILVSSDQQVIAGTDVSMSAFSSSTNVFNWQPNDDLSCTNCSTPSFTANETTAFIVSITDDFGCINQDSVLIEVFDLCNGSSIFIPNIFTPNGDQLNDEFKVTTKQNLVPKINYFRIFDRWGKLMFETNNIKDTWNGNDQNDTPLNNGVYVYTLEIICSDGSNQLLNGNVTLMR